MIASNGPGWTVRLRVGRGSAGDGPGPGGAGGGGGRRLIERGGRGAGEEGWIWLREERQGQGLIPTARPEKRRHGAARDPGASGARPSPRGIMPPTRYAGTRSQRSTSAASISIATAWFTNSTATTSL